MVPYLLALLIGAVAGLRTFVPLAAVRFPKHDWTSILAAVVALGEVVADKFPQMPSRLRVGPMIARCAVGAYAAWVVSTGLGGQPSISAILGIIGAIAGANLGARWRTQLAPQLRIPNVVAALVEDVIAIATAFAIVLET